jgi:hypothetical protein
MLSDGGRKGKELGTDATPPFAGGRCQTATVGGSVYAEVMHEISVVRELGNTKLIGHNGPNHLADLPARPSRARPEQATRVAGNQVAGEVSEGGIPCGQAKAKEQTGKGRNAGLGRQPDPEQTPPFSGNDVRQSCLRSDRSTRATKHGTKGVSQAMEAVLKETATRWTVCGNAELGADQGRGHARSAHGRSFLIGKGNTKAFFPSHDNFHAVESHRC